MSVREQYLDNATIVAVCFQILSANILRTSQLVFTNFMYHIVIIIFTFNLANKNMSFHAITHTYV